MTAAGYGFSILPTASSALMFNNAHAAPYIQKKYDNL